MYSLEQAAAWPGRRSTWTTEILGEGYAYADVGGRPDRTVIESWIGAPSRTVPDTDSSTFTGSVRAFADKFLGGGVQPPK